MISLDSLGWFLITAGIMMLIIGCAFGSIRLIRAERKSREIERKMGFNREISELNFRDKSGILNTVRIIVDHDIEDDATPEDIRDMSIDNLLHNHTFSEGSMEKIQQFIFSAQAVRGMREHGLEPDEVITKMLKASGRMA